MRSSDRNANEASSKKEIKWYTQQVYGSMVERSRSQSLAMEAQYTETKFNICKCCQITVRNANNPMLLRYNNSDKHKSSLAKLQHMISLFHASVLWLTDAQVW